ncbi:hypothetical protein [Thalassomonas actiniarum]|uniref:Lipoprotein n=1 Tax=Thalassomonas actiniarum TaxID=485447 RepID=A0AAF0C2I5_9GAMM|nr:hypothetical protein [Thalassomonas actiniarum]WDD98542.1 hypothetical protein SG35_025355 [Thalassomonas actiniarum]
MSVMNMTGRAGGKWPLKLILPCLWALMISACGGGGGDSGSESNVAPPPADNVIIDQEETPDPIAELKNLVIADDFSFTTKEQVTLTVSLDEYAGQRAYVSLYSDYRLLPSGEYYPIADSRVVAGNLQQGQFHQVFTHLKQQHNYLAEVWLYDLSPPLQRELILNENTLSW